MKSLDPSMMKKTPKPLKALRVYLTVEAKEVWGPVYWKLLHRRAKEQGLTERWLDGFTEAIPCPDCKEHFIELRTKFPRETFADDESWAWAMHNAVNTERSNKPFHSWAEYQRHRDDE